MYFCTLIKHCRMIYKKYAVYILLNFVVILLGFTAILGKLITLDAVNLVFYRTSIATITSFLIALILKWQIRLSLKDVAYLMFIGVLIGLHWITFFWAIKVSNVSVTLACLGVSTLFTSFVEPISQKRKISIVEVLVGILVVLGLAAVFNFEIRYYQGIILAVISFIIAGLFTVINKNISMRYEAITVNLYEMLGAAVSIGLYQLLMMDLISPLALSAKDWLWLLLLAVICTSFAFTATVWIMKKLSAYDVVLAINLEPIYGIVLAYFIFGQEEKMTPGFYAGAILILLAVLLYPFLKRKIYLRKY